MPLRKSFLFAAAALLLLSSTVQSEETSHPWLVTAPRFLKETYFSNLKDDASIETPFLLKFGLTGMGLAAIDKPVVKTGHHHLLVNRGLPTDFSKPLPFTDQYRHFGKGQMETVLTFPPGQYTLQLLLADDKHIPNFVASKQIRITVTKKNEGVDPNGLVKPGIAILAPHPGEAVKRPFRMMLHASGLNVSSATLSKKDTGHFRIKIKPEAGREEVIELFGGSTEAWLFPPTGPYSAYIEFLGNGAPHEVLYKSEPIRLQVKD